MNKRIVLRITLVVVIIIIGFVYLLRSCLSKFDERAAIGGGSSQTASQFLVFEKDGKGVIFSLVAFDKTISYSQQGGSTRKSVKRTYYVQSNDMATAAKLNLQKIKSGNDIKAYPVELLGAADNKAWLFAGELMAFDPFTLEKLADAKTVEEKNPALKGKLINERRYYSFDFDNNTIVITAADGLVYNLNLNTLIAAADGNNQVSDKKEQKIKVIDKQVKILREKYKSAYDRLRQNNLQYQQKQISIKDYQDSAAIIKSEANLLNHQIDSLQEIATTINAEIRNTEANEDRINNARRTGTGYSGMKTNADTLDGRWFGIFNQEDLDNYGDRFVQKQVYKDDARNNLYSTTLSISNNQYWTVGEEKSMVGNQVYLQGGFFLNKETGLPFHLQHDFLVVFKDRIGNEGVVQLARISSSGQQIWAINTGLKEFYDWQLKGEKLIITGTDNKKLSSGEINLMQIIDLQQGGAVAYDFFTDKIRTNK